MTQPSVEINRGLVAFLTLVCLGGALAVWLVDKNGDYGMQQGALARVGYLMIAFWVWLGRGTTVATISIGKLIGLLLAMFVVVRYPRTLIPLLVVLIVVGTFLRPKQKVRPDVRPPT